MTEAKKVLAAVTLGVPLLITGCGGATVETTTSTATTGQQLTDLKKALDSGAITQEEYARQKDKILNRRN